MRQHFLVAVDRDLQPSDERYALVYRESLRAIAAQEAAVDNVRARCAQVLSAASVATAVLGGLSHGGGRHTHLSIATWLAMSSFLALLAICVWIMAPRRGWYFVNSAAVLLDGYVEAEHPATLDEMHKTMATYMEAHWERNQVHLNRRLLGLQIAFALLFVSIAGWFWELVR